MSETSQEDRKRADVCKAHVWGLGAGSTGMHYDFLSTHSFSKFSPAKRIFINPSSVTRSAASGPQIPFLDFEGVYLQKGPVDARQPSTVSGLG